MLEHSIYSVISPEGCASILWRSAANAPEAAAALKLTAEDMKENKLIDGIIAEPIGGAHRHKPEMIESVAVQIRAALKELTPWDGPALKKARAKKFLAMGR